MHTYTCKSIILEVEDTFLLLTGDIQVIPRGPHQSGVVRVLGHFCPAEQIWDFCLKTISNVDTSVKMRHKTIKYYLLFQCTH